MAPTAPTAANADRWAPLLWPALAVDSSEVTMVLETIEQWLHGLGAIAGLATLAAALVAMFRSLRRPAGREERGARFALRGPVLLVVTVLFLGAGALLWRPLPFDAPPWLRVILLVAGGTLFYGGLALYLWGLRTLGRMFGPSSGFGIRLQSSHRLVTTGPYAYIRHPMYLAVIGVGIGSLLLYRTWAALFFAVTMLGLVVRARREERVLADEFGLAWKVYAARVPAWFPRL
jgi:protein-S-isoprenylcysteine O-methyltransferase Ste14